MIVNHVLFLLLITIVGAAAANGSPTTAPANIDADVWAQRNVNVLRRSVDLADSREPSISAFQFSVYYNPKLLDDAYAGEVLKLAELRKSKMQEPNPEIDEIIGLLRLPTRDRMIEARKLTAGKEIYEPPITPDKIVSQIRYLRKSDRATETPKLIDQMEKLAAEKADWGHLGLSYIKLADDATKASDSEQAAHYFDRLLQLEHEHPVFQDHPQRGNTDAPMPMNIAWMAFETGGREKFERFIAAETNQTLRDELAMGLINELARRGNFEATSAAVEKYLRPTWPDAADCIVAALQGRVMLPPTTQPGLRIIFSRDGELRSVQFAIIDGFASRGDLKTVEKMKVSFPPSAAMDQGYVAHEWAEISLSAAENGHEDAANRGFSRALEELKKYSLISPSQLADTIAIVNEAVSIHDYQLAARILGTSSPPGTWARLELSEAYRKLGNTEKSRAQLEETLRQSYQSDEKAGAIMAEIAVRLHELGEQKRAERVLLDSLARIHGEDFGFGGTSVVVDAAVKMNRLDLLDRLYEQSEDGNKMLLCIVACRRATNTDEESD